MSLVDNSVYIVGAGVSPGRGGEVPAAADRLRIQARRLIFYSVFH